MWIRAEAEESRESIYQMICDLSIAARFSGYVAQANDEEWDILARILQAKIQDLHRNKLCRGFRLSKHSPNPDALFAVIYDADDAQVAMAASMVPDSARVIKDPRFLCDVCSEDIGGNEGYLIAAADVVASEAYWLYYYSKFLSLGGVTLRDLAKGIHAEVASLGSSDTPWVVCENCSVMFAFDKNNARNLITKWRSTGEPSSGFRICRCTMSQDSQTVESLDDSALLRGFNAAAAAISELEKRGA